MTSQSQSDSCLECHRDGLQIQNHGSTSFSDSQVQADWDCWDHDHPICEEDETCCDVDDCHIDCGSVCDGVVDCGSSTACSVAHCDDTHCNEQNCESTDPVCFDDHCCDGSTEQDCGFDFYGFNPQFPFDASSMLSTMLDPLDDTATIAGHLPSAHADPCYHQVFSTSYQAHANHCDQKVVNHLGCQEFQKDLQAIMPTQQLPFQSVVNTEDIFHLFGVCSDFSVCHDQLLAGNHTEVDHPKRQMLDHSPTLLDCFHSGQPHVESDFKNPNDLNIRPVKGPHRNYHRCRAQHHPSSHPYSPYSPHSRQSRSSVSSHFVSSPGETPPPLDRGSSSVLTSPDFSPEDSDLHVCRWTTNINGVKMRCGATFGEAGALQDHMIASHMNTLDGAKGHGYYCCWEGCLRPDEPFSQKSKLQGHFLTHSNYRNFWCSVCGKHFARQATLDRHERSHRGDKRYKCKDCGKTFTDSSELKTHSRTHTGEKPFKCTYPGCNFQTGDSSNMSSHRLTHGERKHKCTFPGCSKSFTRPDQLKRHQRTTHKQDISSTLPSPSPEHFNLAPFAVV